MTCLGWNRSLLRSAQVFRHLPFSAFRLIPALIVAAGMLVLVSVQAQSQQVVSPEQTQTDRAAIEYKVVISSLSEDGLSGGDVMDLLTKSSRLEQLKDKPPSSIAGLKRRVREDSDNFNKVLRSEGYYDNKITFDIDEITNPVKITFQIDPGPKFKISKFDIRFLSDRLVPEALKLSDIGITFGMVARSEDIVNAQNQVMVILADHGYPDAKIADQETIVDFATQQMETTLILNEGPRLVMSNLLFEGLQTVDANYLSQLAEWKAGVLYNARVIDELRRTYLRTGLFDSVHLKPRNESVDSASAQIETEIGGVVVAPIILSFVEREHKSIGLGGSFSTSEGAGTQLFWENRNTFGEGEKLRADLTVAQIRQQFKFGFVKPNYLRLDQKFHSDINLRRENTEAYDEQSVIATAGIERKWRGNWVVGAGLSFELSEIEDEDGTENYSFASLPLTARYDSTNDLLDPTTGFRFGTTATPYYGLNAASPDFLRAEIDGSTYYSVLDNNRLVLAARGKIGMMAGDSAREIPATKRFYAGGGGSIRGYEHQTVGPLNSSDDPVGGRSLIEVGVEARIKITEEIGLVPFIEGGNVYDSMVPNFSENFQWGAGLGLRYYTAIGPIRLDVAVPINRRDDVDDAFQFYISIGQAF
ncbi:autotransporter assembly complex protein TamA [Kiloniella antarctica]|uniref:Autotransporter assembly complex family protein n=1 Tax=Kiloniella antarctica TaxID=1550907 RepID=A0ABW5BJ51_9PROT